MTNSPARTPNAIPAFTATSLEPPLEAVEVDVAVDEAEVPDAAAGVVDEPATVDDADELDAVEVAATNPPPMSVAVTAVEASIAEGKTEEETEEV